MQPQPAPILSSCVAIGRGRLLMALLALAACTGTGPLAAAVVIAIPNSSFDQGGGEITSQLNPFSAATAMGPVQIGGSGWYGLANATNGVPFGGFRPGVEVDNDASSADRAQIRYNLGALGSLTGLEMPEATLWRPLSGFNLLPNQTYTFRIEVDAGSLFDVAAFATRGFGIGITTGSSTSSVGTYYADTLSNPSLMSLELASGTVQRLSLTFTTGAAVPSGTMGVAVFGGRGTQVLQASSLTDYNIDNASLTMIPEPHTALLGAVGCMALLRRRHPRER